MFLILLFKVFGVKVGLFFIIQSIVANIFCPEGRSKTLEIINYIQHYGLKRETNKVSIYNSWNSYRYLSNKIIFNLPSKSGCYRRPKHSDHHTNSMKRYQNLKYVHDSAELPYSFPIMMLLIFVPSLWRLTMNPLCEYWNKKSQ